MSFAPSPYQQGIFNWIERGDGNAVVNAVAGSGKTTTAVRGAELMRGDGLFIAFSKAIAEELKRRLQHTNMEARTVHSLGYGIVAKALNKRLRVDERKYWKLVKPAVEEELQTDDWTLIVDHTRNVCQIIDLLRVNLLEATSENVETISDNFALDYEDWYVDMAQEYLEKGLEQAKEFGIVDWTDMVWLPNILENAQFPMFDWVVVDEAQDINNAQRAFIFQCVNPFTGRLLAIGDPRQAIFGFAGANAQSFDLIAQESNATQLPLSVCYRCPSSHLDLAREIVPYIENGPSAKQGIVGNFRGGDLLNNVQQGDLILCRTTAPLVSNCIELIKNRVRAKVKGRDIGRSIWALAKKVRRWAEDDSQYLFEVWPVLLEQYKHQELKKMEEKDKSDAVKDSFIDRVTCLDVIYDEFSPKTWEDYEKQVDELFSDSDATVYFSTAHRSKGLENHRILLLEPERMPLVWKNQLPWQYEQEMNLKYVALTRSTYELWFIETEQKD